MTNNQQNEWLPIETAPTKKMFVIIAMNVELPSGIRYTSDPYCTFRYTDGSFARWPHSYSPTHWCSLPEIPRG